jgi:hypothetical protein
MGSYNETLQKVWHDYERENGYSPTSRRYALKWGVAKGLLPLPSIDPYDRISEDMSKALREEYATDKRAGSVCLNNFGSVVKWISTLVMLHPGWAAAR